MRLAQRIRETTVDPGSLALFWLSQAGFVYKTPAGKVIYIDPYLTNYVARTLPEYGQGFKRLMGTPIEAEEVETDFYISTHSHGDHLDLDAMAVIARDPRVRFIGAPDCRESYEQLGLSKSRYTILDKGQTLDLDDFRLTGVYADHGELAPDALGVMLTVGDIRVWQVGDTAYRPERWQDIFAVGIDVIIPPINGAFGNLNAVDAAKLVRDSHARIAIPCHFWMFPLHDGDPAQFLEACTQHAPEAKALLLSQGELYVVRK